MRWLAGWVLGLRNGSMPRTATASPSSRTPGLFWPTASPQRCGNISRSSTRSRRVIHRAQCPKSASTCATPYAGGASISTDPHPPGSRRPLVAIFQIHGIIRDPQTEPLGQVVARQLERLHHQPPRDAARLEGQIDRKPRPATRQRHKVNPHVPQKRGRPRLDGYAVRHIILDKVDIQVTPTPAQYEPRVPAHPDAGFVARIRTPHFGPAPQRRALEGLKIGDFAKHRVDGSLDVFLAAELHDLPFPPVFYLPKPYSQCRLNPAYRQASSATGNAQSPPCGQAGHPGSPRRRRPGSPRGSSSGHPRSHADRW